MALTEQGRERLQILQQSEKEGKITPQGRKRLNILKRESSAPAQAAPQPARKQNILRRIADVATIGPGLNIGSTIRGIEKLPEDIRQDLPEIVGGGIGGAIGGPPGAALGAGGASVLKQAAQVALGSPRAPKSVGGFVGEAALEAGVAASGEKLGALAIKAASKALAPFAKTVIPKVKELTETIRRFGGELSAPQATQSKLLDLADNIARGGFFSSDDIAKFDAKNITALDKFSGEVGDKIARGAQALDLDQGGALIKDIIKTGEELHGTTASKFYAQVDNLNKVTTAQKVVSQAGLDPATFQTITTELVPSLPIKNVAAGIIKSASKIKNIGVSGDLLSMARSVSELPSTMSFESASLLRSKLLSKARDLAAQGTTSPLKEINRLASSLDESMEIAAKELDPKSLEAWRKANRFFKRGKETFETKFIDRILNSDPIGMSKIGQSFFRSGNAETVKTVRRAILKSSALQKESFKKNWSKVQSSFLEDMLQTSRKGTGDMNFIQLSRKLRDPQTRLKMRALYNPDQLKDLKKFFDLGEIVQKKSAAGTGAFGLAQLSGIGRSAQTLSGLALGGAALGADLGLGGFIAGLGVPILAGPKILAKALTDPKFSKFLIKGASLPKGSKSATTFLSRLAAKSSQLLLESNEQR